MILTITRVFTDTVDTPANKVVYKYKEKLLYAKTVFRVPVKVPKTKSLKLGPVAARP